MTLAHLFMRFSILLIFVLNSTATAETQSTGMYVGDTLPDNVRGQRGEKIWTDQNGQAEQAIEEAQWVVRNPQDFLRGIDLGFPPRMMGQKGMVEVQWATDCENNHNAEGFRVRAQGRCFRVHPIYRPNEPDMLLVGCASGLRPTLLPSRVDPDKIPGFDATKLNTYHVEWTTNKENTYQFSFYLNNRHIGDFGGQPLWPNERQGIAFEFREGTHRIANLKWKLFEGGDSYVEQALQLTNHPQLLFDEHLVEKYDGLTRTIHQPEMHPANPILQPERPWEYGAVLLWGTVIYDEEEDLFKMWYMTWANRKLLYPQKGYLTPVCYATSKNGVDWVRPDFDHCLFKIGNQEDLNGPLLEYPVNNIVFNLPESELGMDSPTVIKDLTDPDSNFRYKMTYWHRLPTGEGIYQAHSADGIHWTHIPHPVIQSGDRNTFHWDPFRKKWMVITRPHASFFELESFAEFNHNFIRTQITVDAIDRAPPKRSTDVYSCTVFNYGGMQIGIPEFYGRKTSNRWISHLSWSYDGVHWTVDPKREPWMPWSDRPGDFDCWRRNIHNGGVIRRGDKLWIYFSGRSQGKPTSEISGYLVPSGEPGYDPRGIVGSIGLATLRVDGFCSRDAGPDVGSLRTKVFYFDGSPLLINADVSSDGYVRAALLNEHGQPLDGFALNDCTPVTGDSITHSISWRGQTDLTSWAGQPLRLQLELKNAQLYSFRFDKP